MKKNLAKLLLGIGILGLTIAPVLAENFTYKTYNPRTNKTQQAVLGTITLTDTQYLWGFYTPNGQPVCIINLNTNTDNQGLVGGNCDDYEAFIQFMSGNSDIDMSKFQHGWRELNKNTFYKELEVIKKERAAQGKQVFGE